MENKWFNRENWLCYKNLIKLNLVIMLRCLICIRKTKWLIKIWIFSQRFWFIEMSCDERSKLGLKSISYKWLLDLNDLLKVWPSVQLLVVEFRKTKYLPSSFRFVNLFHFIATVWLQCVFSNTTFSDLNTEFLIIIFRIIILTLKITASLIL